MRRVLRDSLSFTCCNTGSLGSCGFITGYACKAVLEGRSRTLPPFLITDFSLFTFRQALKDKHIEHRFTVAAIESFDEAVLHRPAWLDELEPDVMLLSPIGQRHRDHFWPIV